MMLRATVVDVNPRDPTRVWVMIPQKYGTKPVRVFTRVEVTKGDHVYVANTSVTRVPQWVVFDHQTEIGRWGNPYPHTHPIGQVDGLVDWVSQYETWTKDHQARLDAADQQIAEGKTQIDAARKDLTQAQSDIAAGVREAALERARLDQVETNLEQTARNVTAAGTRIAANEAALTAGQQRLDSAETAVQKAQADLEDGSGLAAKVAGFLTISAMTGVFTKSLTAQDAALLGTTVADTLNVTGMLRGRDAILDGTLDVAPLNVTGAMSAKIILASDVNARRGFFTEGLTAQDAALLGTTVAEKLVVTDAFSARVVNAMTAQTKQLVVTEDAILNRATIVQSLVTPELISQKADIGDLAARMVTSGKLQTSTAANRGVKIDNAGIRAWDDTGQQTVQINGRSNLVQGAFRTGTTGARIGIDSNADSAYMDVYGPNSDKDHGSIIYTAGDTGPLNSSLTLMAMGSYSGDPNNPALRLFPLRGTFAFQGRWARDTDPMKFIVLINNTGLSAGQYNTIDVPYGTAFPTNNALRFPFVSVESANGADIMATIVTQTDKMIRINVINKSGSKGSGALVVKIATFNVGAL